MDDEIVIEGMGAMVSGLNNFRVYQQNLLRKSRYNHQEVFPNDDDCCRACAVCLLMALIRTALGQRHLTVFGC